jgi:Uma2 family endonuclease
MAQAAPTAMSVEAFFDWQADQAELYELVEGRPVPRAMTGATQRHDRVVTNAIAALASRLRGGPCWPMTADIAVRTRSRSIRRPDLTVQCAPLEPDAVVAAEPVLILEVLSPSTERIDTIIKLDEYKALTSVRHILIAEPDTPHVLLYSRDASRGWAGLDHIGADTELELPAIRCTLPIAELYEGLA